MHGTCRDHSKPPPWPLYIIGLKLLAFVQWLARRIQPGPIFVMNTVGGLVRAQILETVSDLRIPDALAEGPKSAAQLAKEKSKWPAELAQLLKGGCTVMR